MLESIVRYFSGENKLYNNVKGQIPSSTPGDGVWSPSIVANCAAAAWAQIPQVTLFLFVWLFFPIHVQVHLLRECPSWIRPLRTPRGAL